MPQRLSCILIFHRNLYGGSSSKTETREPFVNRRQMITRTTKTLLAVAHDLLTWRRFDDHKQGPRYRGVYATYQEAEAALPKGRDHGFHEDVPDFFKKTQLGFNQSDYPVLLRLLQALKPGAAVFDFGGGLGQCFYSYQQFIEFPPGLTWTVCDVESFLEQGPKLAHERGVENLFFTSDRMKASGATAFITNGTLQYVEEDLSEILRRLPELPEHVLVNRVPMYKGKPYYTVQSSLHSFIPYKIMNTGELIERMSRIGYDAIDQWNLPRTLHVPLHYDHFVPHFRGIYFRYRKG